MSAGNVIEQSYEEIGIAEELPYKWSSPLDWLSCTHPDEYEFCIKYSVDNDQVQDQHQDAMDADGFFDRKSNVDCSCCGENIAPGKAYYRIDYADGSSQEPLCRSCVDEAMEETQ